MTVLRSTNYGRTPFLHYFDIGLRHHHPDGHRIGDNAHGPRDTVVAGATATPRRRIAEVLCAVAFFAWCALPMAVWFARLGLSAWAQN